ncbi:MAG: REP element-mobilizing transposase RayT [Psychroserpens sp.]|jgi:REP element-mobilizing transposase RayT
MGYIRDIKKKEKNYKTKNILKLFINQNIQICEAEGIEILIGVVSKDHIHIEYRPSQDIITIVKLMKGRSSRKL